MDKPPHDTLVPQRRGERKMACDIDDREGGSPLPTEPRLGWMFHSSATGRRRELTLPETPRLRQAPHLREGTAGSAGDARGSQPTGQISPASPVLSPGSSRHSA